MAKRAKNPVEAVSTSRSWFNIKAYPNVNPRTYPRMPQEHHMNRGTISTCPPEFGIG
jgi:hypothetical protein